MNRVTLRAVGHRPPGSRTQHGITSHGEDREEDRRRRRRKPTDKKLADRRRSGSGNQVKKGPHGGTLVVLVDDLAHVGKQGDLVEVKPGYARNYLLPYGQAVIPTDENLSTLDQYKIKVAEGPRGQGRGPQGAGRAALRASRPSPSRPTRPRKATCTAPSARPRSARRSRART